MAINPNEHHLITSERARDARREAEVWRQYQAIRRHEQAEPHDPAVVLGIRRLIARLREARVEPAGPRAGSTSRADVATSAK